jgi:DNA uptake protein ComE-like DNA-binding protein
MALIFVLWLVVLLTAIAFQMTYRGHLCSRATAATGDATRAFFIARAGVESAIADVATNYKTAAAQNALRENSERHYESIPLGSGTYTVFATIGNDGTPRYGLTDECAKININTADAKLLGRLTPMENGLAELIVALWEEVDAFEDLRGLLPIDGVDQLDLYGEDQNDNGLLDSNENDGEQSWPPDNGDGVLDRGLSAYLTVWSAARDVDADGEVRINLSDDSADEIAGALADVSEQQADSIVYHRNKNSFSSVLDLLNVGLVEKVKKVGNSDGNSGQPGGQPRENQEAHQGQNTGNVQQEQEGKEDERAENPEEGTPPDAEKEAEAARQKEEESEFTYNETGQKAFDEESFRKIADRVTVEEEEFAPGRINVNTASLEVLACLPGLDESIALAIIHERQSRADGFTSLVDLLDVSGIDFEQLKGLYGIAAVRSDVFALRSFGVLKNSRVFASVSAVVDRTEDTIALRFWREHG